MASTLPPLSATAISAFLPATGAFTGATMQALGDSIVSNYVSYSQYNAPAYQAQLAAIPAWASGVPYGVGTLVKSVGYAYRCTVAGTAGATAPTGIVSAFSDGGATWTSVPTLSVNKAGQHMCSWAEFYNNRLNFDQSLGYGGIVNSLSKVIVIAGGQNYAAGDTISFGSASMTATLAIVGGVITGVMITNPGYDNGLSITYAIQTATGSGAVLSPIRAGTGSFGVPGCKIMDMRARLPDVLTAKPSILVVHGGTNDATAGTPYASAWADLKYIYDTCQANGIKVVAVPVSPRSYAVTPAVKGFVNRLNRAIRSYCRNDPNFNTFGYSAIALADPTKYWTDGTNNGVVGGLGGVAYALTVEGLHNTNRGAQYTGWAIAKAVERWVGTGYSGNGRCYGSDDGYDPVLNPGGNMLEGYDWQANALYVVGQQCNANGNVFYCATPGTSAASGGPSGTGSNITDGSAKWTYMGSARASVFAAGSSGTLTAVSGVTSGSVATGFTLARQSGSATGSVNAAVESPWSSGQAGQRQTISYSLGGGTTTERWDFILSYGSYNSYVYRNIRASDLGVTPFMAEADVEIANIAMMTRLCLFCGNADGDKTTMYAGASAAGVGYELIPSSGDPLVFDLGGLPNAGRMTLRFGPFVFPPNLLNFVMGLSMGFNASGAVGSATAVVKINAIGFFKYGVS